LLTKKKMALKKHAPAPKNIQKETGKRSRKKKMRRKGKLTKCGGYVSTDGQGKGDSR